MKYVSLIFGLFLTACLHTAQSSEQLEVRVVQASLHCAPQAGVQLISSQAQWTSLYPQQTMPDLNWDNQNLLQIRMGAQPNPGYRLEFSRAYFDNEQLYIKIHWLQPAPGAIYPQMIVEPCIVLAIPRYGYQKIVIQDQDHTVRYVLDK